MKKLVNKYAVLVVSVLAAVSVYGLSGLPNAANLASWAQAVGSVAAVVAAILVATRDDRRRAAEKLAEARITAASLAYRISEAKTTVKKHLDLFEPMRKYDGPSSHFNNAAQEIAGLDLGNKVDHIALIPLPNRCAFKLTGANGRLPSIARNLDNLYLNNRMDFNVRKQGAEEAFTLLGELYHLLCAVAEECELASQNFTRPDVPGKTD